MLYDLQAMVFALFATFRQNSGWAKTPALVGLIVCLFACAPSHTVKPLPDFVDTALEPGDKISVKTHDGKVSEFIVTDIRDEIIYGEGAVVPLRNIATLHKISWKRPASPCGGEKPLGCSVPLLIQLSSDSHAHFGKQFYDACAQHDYCYRHGYRSYGLDRDNCDQEFLDNMLAACPKPPANLAAKIIGLLDDSVGSRSKCLSRARDFHAAVRHFGEKKFKTTDSTYCEYDGPPTENE